MFSNKEGGRQEVIILQHLYQLIILVAQKQNKTKHKKPYRGVKESSPEYGELKI